MRKLRCVAILGMLVLFTGCVRSLHELYTEKDIIFEQGLIGEWTEGDSEETWKFSKEGEKEYTLVYTDDKGKQGTFSAHLLKIKGKVFLDFFPTNPNLRENDFYKWHLLPVHTFAYVKQIEPTLQMSFPGTDWLKKMLEKNPSVIRHEKIDDEIILTASTRDLQTFWLKHLETEGSFGDLSNMKRKAKTDPEGRPNKPDAGDGK